MLHTDKDFVSQMAKAVREYKEKYTAISTAKLAEETADAPVYNLQGVRLQGAPARRGIYIKGNKKIAY